MALFELLRPYQWTKNVLCFAGLIFGGRLFDFNAVAISTVVFLVFSASASTIYIFNDMVDRTRDQVHPKKKDRPIASGRVNLITAGITAVVLGIISLITAYIIGKSLFVIIVIYMLNNIFYSIHLKHVPIIDVSSIALGFVLRLVSGIIAIGDTPTAWIVLCTLFLAIFLGFSKRRAELHINGNHKQGISRPVLDEYSISFLDSMVNSAAIMTVMSFALFTTTSGKNSTLVLTVPIVYYAIMHYHQMVRDHDGGEEPELMLVKDWRIWLSILIWGVLFVIIYYYDIQLFTNSF